MKKLLIISPIYPFPEKCGFTRRVGDMCSYLSKYFKQHIFICGDTKHVADTSGVGIFDNVIHADIPKGGSHSLPSLYQKIQRKFFKPHFDSKFYMYDGIVNQIKSLHNIEKYDACIIHTPSLARCLNAFPESVYRIVDSHDIWHEKYLNFKSLGQGRLLENFRCRQREIDFYRSADLVLGISLWDYDYLLKNDISSIYCPVSFVPKPLPPRKKFSCELLYSSGQGVINSDSIDYFMRHIMPSVKAEFPMAILKIANPSEEILAAYGGNPDIVCLPFFDDPVTVYLESDLIVVPLRFANGLKIKVLESFSLGKPTIVSSAAVQGVPVSKYAQETISNSPESFAKEVVNALRSSDYRGKLVLSGLAIVRDGYSPERVYSELVDRISGIK